MNVGGAGAIELGDGRHQIDELCELFVAVFGHAISAAHWRWKYLAGPRLANVHALLRDRPGGQLIGHVGAHMLAGLRAGQPVRMVQICDVMVHPRARGGLGPQGAYRQLTAALLRELQGVGPTHWPLFAYGFPGQRPFALGQRLGIYRRLYDGLEGELDTRRPCHAALLDRLRGWQLQALPTWDEAVVRAAAERCREALAADAASAARPRVDKTAAYLRWRYAEHPAQAYAFWIVAQPPRRPTGWFVTALRPRPIVVDSGLAAVPGGLPRALGLLGRAMPDTCWLAWLPPAARVAAQPLTIVPTEFGTADTFHPDWPAPFFQPGDTDVF